MNPWVTRSWAFVLSRMAMARRDDRGAGTVEYAVCVLAGAAFAAVLYVIVNSDAVSAQLSELLTSALEMDV